MYHKTLRRVRERRCREEKDRGAYYGIINGDNRRIKRQNVKVKEQGEQFHRQHEDLERENEESRGLLEESMRTFQTKGGPNP